MQKAIIGRQHWRNHQAKDYDDEQANFLHSGCLLYIGYRLNNHYQLMVIFWRHETMSPFRPYGPGGGGGALCLHDALDVQASRLKAVAIV